MGRVLSAKLSNAAVMALRHMDSLRCGLVQQRESGSSRRRRRLPLGRATSAAGWRSGGRCWLPVGGAVVVQMGFAVVEVREPAAALAAAAVKQHSHTAQLTDQSHEAAEYALGHAPRE